MTGGDRWLTPDQPDTAPLCIAIKTPVPDPARTRLWGDWPFAEALARAFLRLGHSVRIDCRSNADEDRSSATCEVVLFGGLNYDWSAQIPGIAWLIYPPPNRKLGPEHFRGAAHLFIASPIMARLPEYHAVAPTSFLPQACDRHVMAPGSAPRAGIVFVANNHFGEDFRPIAKLAMESGLPFRL